MRALGTMITISVAAALGAACSEDPLPLVGDAGPGAADGGVVSADRVAPDAELPPDGGEPADTGEPADSGEVPDSGPPTEPFSFFVTSLRAIQEVSGSPEGFGGDLRFGEEGPGAGLRGADKICATIAERSMPGASQKQWRAFLSAVAGEDGEQVDAIDRIGEGPWYDRLGRLLAASKADLLHDRPVGAHATIVDDFPNEDGVPNHRPDPTQGQVDNHDMLTGTNDEGQLYSPTATCLDWTSAEGNRAREGRPRVGHSWPRRMGGGGGGGGGPGGINSVNWMSSLDESGCAPGVAIVERGPPMNNEVTVGSGGGYGGFYCFALIP